MTQIGSFTRNADGSYTGSIKTLAFDVKARLVPSDSDLMLATNGAGEERAKLTSAGHVIYSSSRAVPTALSRKHHGSTRAEIATRSGIRVSMGNATKVQCS